MFARACVVSLLLSTSSAVAADCSAYPAGTWKFDAASALRFEQVWLDNLQQKNTAALDCMLALEFKDTSRQGALRPKEQVLRELASKAQQDYRQTLTQLSANLFGQTAVVHGVNVISDKQGRELLRIRFTDVLHYTNGRWLAIAAQETDEKQP